MTHDPFRSSAKSIVMIAGKTVGSEISPFLVAELPANQGGDLKRALRVIAAAAEAVTDAVRYQAYTLDSLTLNIDRLT